MAQPVKKFQCGKCSTSVFVNENERNGEMVESKSVVLQKRFRKPDGEWQSTNSFFERELDDAIRVLEMARDYVRPVAVFENETGEKDPF